jgi:hypothetical protein
VSTTPDNLDWGLPAELHTALRFAETRPAELIHQHECRTVAFRGYNKHFMTALGLSPDAFCR